MVKYGIIAGLVVAKIGLSIIGAAAFAPAFSVTATMSMLTGAEQVITAGSGMTYLECIAVKEKVTIQLEMTLSVAKLESVECVL